MPKRAGLVVAGLILASCQSGPPGPEGSRAHPLEGTTWRVREIDGRPTLDRPASTLVVESRARVSGGGGCNRFFGRADLDGERIAIGQVGSTKMACAPAVMDQEQRYLRALEAAASWDREGDMVVLRDAGGRPRLRLAP